jgi:hypothetical protein
MSGGAAGLAGHIYQQDYVAFRILASAVVADVPSYAPLRRISAFTIEGRLTADGEIWDVSLSFPDDTTHLLECKDTAIRADDRRHFYLRIRREIAAGTRIDALSAGWVTDPEKQAGSKIIDHFLAMRAIARGAGAIRTSKPKEVNSATTALQEALYYLCHETHEELPAISVESAASLLARLVVDQFSWKSLRESVATLASEVLEVGTGETLRQTLIGTFTDRITRERFVTDTLDSFLASIKSTASIAKIRGELRDFLRKHSAAHYTPTAQLVVWERLENAPKIEWPLSERIHRSDLRRSCIIVGAQGTGKTTTSIQALNEQLVERDHHHALWLDAALLHPGWIAQLPAFLSVLCGLSPTWLAVDGLDRIGRDKRAAWQDCLDRLLTLPNLIVNITAREEVLVAGEWLQRLTTSLPHITLSRLDTPQVQNAFRRVGLPGPTNHELLQALRNAFLLSLYAKIATVQDMPLGVSGSVTAFQVVREFWQRRVRAPSEGHRCLGPEEESSATKRAAILYLVDETRKGKIVIRLPRDDARTERGIRMLAFEGVLQEYGTHAVGWIHDWLREYALVDSLVGELQHPGTAQLAGHVCRIEIDHLARTVAVGVAKWVIADSRCGPIEQYLLAVHQRKRGLASDAIASLLEDSSRTLRLESLSDVLLIETVDLARKMKMPQWAGQISSLPEARFAGPDGAKLLHHVNQYELEISDDG